MMIFSQKISFLISLNHIERHWKVMNCYVYVSVLTLQQTLQGASTVSLIINFVMAAATILVHTVPLKGNLTVTRDTRLDNFESRVSSLMSPVESVMSLQLDCSYEELSRQRTRRFCVPLQLFYWSGRLLRKSSLIYAYPCFALCKNINMALFLVLRRNICFAFPSHRLNPRKAGDNWATAAWFPIQASFSSDRDRHRK